jgi:hypothetical protein
MSKSSERVKTWRKNSKVRIVKAMGSQCQVCGYSKCTDVLDLHHIDPTQKELSFGAIRANPTSWTNIVIELRKCILLCANCHREIHAGIINLPDVYKTFDETYLEYKLLQEDISLCPICSGPKNKWTVTCSRKCAGSTSGKINWSEIDLLKLKETLSNVKIADMLNVTESAVRKRLKKIIPV